jgi:hypothetical protein
MPEPSRLVQMGFLSGQALALGRGLVGEIRSGVWDATLDISRLAECGWLWLDGGTIGNAASGAGTRANQDVYDLYKHLWDRVSDTYCPVATGRGASALADFNAGKQLTLPDLRGKALYGCTFGGSLLAPLSLGATIGTDWTAVFVAINYIMAY